MAVKQLQQGERQDIMKTNNSAITRIDIGIRFSSEQLDINAVIDIGVVCKSKTNGIYTIWYGNPKDEQESICDLTTQCNGNSWNDDDLRVSIDFAKLPTDIQKMSIITSILWGKDLKKHFGMIKQGCLHIYSYQEKSDIIQQVVTNWSIHKDMTGLIWAEIYQYNGNWKIRAIEESIICKDLGELAQIAGSYL